MKAFKSLGRIIGRPRQEQMGPGSPEVEEQRRAQEEARRKRAEEQKNREAIIQGLALGRVIWRGEMCGDLGFYAKNNDAVLGIFFCHELHPFSRWKRAVVKASGMAANFGMACMFMDYSSCQKEEGGFFAECNKEGDEFVQAASVGCALAVSVMLFMMYWFYTCRCARPGGPLHFGKTSGSCVVCLTKPIVFAFAVVCWGIFLVGFSVHKRSGLDIGDSLIPRVWLTAEVYSFVMGLCVQVVMFYSLWCGCGCCPCCSMICRECWGSGQGTSGARPSFCYPHGDAYPNDEEMMWGGDRSCGTYGYQDDRRRRGAT